MSRPRAAPWTIVRGRRPSDAPPHDDLTRRAAAALAEGRDLDEAVRLSLSRTLDLRARLLIELIELRELRRASRALAARATTT